MILAIFTAGVVGVSGMFYFKLLKWEDIASLWSHVPIFSQSPNGYVAVYLTNGKVYFGKIDRPNSQEPMMSDVFFLNATTAPSPTLKGKQESSQDASVVLAPQTEFQLIRLTDQFQAPIDRLTITRDHILYWEELSSDSKVVQAIAKYHENQGK